MDKTDLIKQLTELKNQKMETYEDIADIYDHFRMLINENVSDGINNHLENVIEDKHITHPDDEGITQLELAYQKGFSDVADAGGELFKSLAQIASYDSDSYIENNGPELYPDWYLLTSKDLVSLIRYTVKAIKKNDPTVLDQLLD